MANFTPSFKPFIDDLDVSPNQKEFVTAPLWSNSQTNLIQIFTSSAQSAIQQQYYYEIFNSQSIEIGAEPQFSIAYGDLVGSGSSSGSAANDLQWYPTRAVYKQYRQLLLPPTENIFTFYNGETSEHIYILNINRSRFKDKVDTKNWQLSISHLNAGAADPASGVITLIDDSSYSTVEYAQAGGRVFNIRSGSIQDGIYTADTTPWGLFYPDNGVIILNGKALDMSASFDTQRTPATASGEDNAFNLFTSISGAIAYDTASYAFQGRTSEVISSTYYFVRAFNGEFNYSNNPSFYTGSSAKLKYDSMLLDPRSYITTVGLYDDEQQLLAVAKLSKPIPKSFDSEIIIKIKLDY
ncbi:hypothetical protein [Microcystis phage Mel-JY01]